MTLIVKDYSGNSSSASHTARLRCFNWPRIGDMLTLTGEVLVAEMTCNGHSRGYWQRYGSIRRDCSVVQYTCSYHRAIISQM